MKQHTGLGSLYGYTLRKQQEEAFQGGLVTFSKAVSASKYHFAKWLGIFDY